MKDSFFSVSTLHHCSPYLMETILERGSAKILYQTNAFDASLFSQLRDEVPWRQNKIRMFGKELDEPRLTAWYGPAYQYSNIIWEEKAFSATMEKLRAEVSKRANFEFNAVLLNLYRDGNDSMGWHRDNEPEMDTRCIASVTLGASRTFKVRSRETKEVWNLELEDGSLLLMHDLQEAYEHAVPKRKKVLEPRINLTFRRIRT